MGGTQFSIYIVSSKEVDCVGSRISIYIVNR